MRSTMSSRTGTIESSTKNPKSAAARRVKVRPASIRPTAGMPKYPMNRNSRCDKWPSRWSPNCWCSVSSVARPALASAITASPVRIAAQGTRPAILRLSTVHTNAMT